MKEISSQTKYYYVLDKILSKIKSYGSYKNLVTSEDAIIIKENITYMRNNCFVANEIVENLLGAMDCSSKYKL